MLASNYKSPYSHFSKETSEVLVDFMTYRHLSFSFNKVLYGVWRGGPGVHSARVSFCASHPVAPGSNPGIPRFLQKMVDVADVNRRHCLIKWTEN